MAIIQETEIGINKEILLKMYRDMYLIRVFEETLYYLFLKRNMPGTMHQYTGQEAIAVGFCHSLRKEDYITSTHRGHGHCLAKGANLNEVMAEIFSKKTGCNHGMGGSMHLADYDTGILGANGIVGGGIPIATGAGLSIDLRGTDQVVVCFFGEGAANTGAFHEGINLAAVWDLPVIFVCENNLYQVSTHISQTMKIPNVAHRAEGYGIKGIVVDGNDVIEVNRIAEEVITMARGGKGPTLVECMTYRYKGHSRFEPGNYRPNGELSYWQERDPLKVFRVQVHKHIREEELTAIEKDVKEKIEESILYAEEGPDINPEDISAMVWSI